MQGDKQVNHSSIPLQAIFLVLGLGPELLYDFWDTVLTFLLTFAAGQSKIKTGSCRVCVCACVRACARATL